MFMIATSDPGANQAESMAAPSQPYIEVSGNSVVATVPVHTLAKGECHEALTPSNLYGESTLEELRARILASVSDGRADMRRALFYWRYDTLVFRCTSFLAELMNARVNVECEDQEFKDLVEIWLNYAMPHTFRDQFYRDLVRLGMVPVIKTLIPYVPREYRYNRRPIDGNENIEKVELATGADESDTKSANLAAASHEAMDQYRKAVANMIEMEARHEQGLCSEARLMLYRHAAAAAQAEWLPKSVPGAYSILDPMSVTMEGPKELSWLREPFLSVSAKLREAVKNPTPLQIRVIEQLPIEVVQQIRSGRTKVSLPANICSVCFMEKQGYEPYPVPMVCHAEKALDIKFDQWESDRTTIRSVRNRILQVTIGSDTFPVTDPQEMAALAAMFKVNARTMTLFWNHTLNIKWIEPESKGVLDEKKYAVLNDEIRTAFGVPALLTGTGTVSGSIGNSSLSFKGLKERVEAGQAIFLEFARGEIDMLRKALGVGWDVRVTYDEMNLEDPITYRQMLSQLVQAGIYDVETVLEKMGEHFPSITKRMERVKALQKNGLFLPTTIQAQDKAAESALDLAKFQLKNAPAPAAPAAKKSAPAGRPTGGKPAGNRTAVNNKTQRGKPKKASAKLAMWTDDQPVLVLSEANDDHDDVLALAEVVGLDASRVMDAESFEKATGRKVMFYEEWPQLGPGDLMAAAVEVVKVEQAMASLRQESHAKWRSEHGRSKYLTESVKQSLDAQVKQDAMAQYAIASLNEEERQHRLGCIMNQIGRSNTGMSGESAELACHVLLHRQHQMATRAAAATAAPAEKTT